MGLGLHVDDRNRLLSSYSIVAFFFSIELLEDSSVFSLYTLSSLHSRPGMFFDHQERELEIEFLPLGNKTDKRR